MPFAATERSVYATACSGFTVPVTVTGAAPSTFARTSTVDRTRGSEDRLATFASTSVSDRSTGGWIERSVKVARPRTIWNVPIEVRHAGAAGAAAGAGSPAGREGPSPAVPSSNTIARTRGSVSRTVLTLARALADAA